MLRSMLHPTLPAFKALPAATVAILLGTPLASAQSLKPERIQLAEPLGGLEIPVATPGGEVAFVGGDPLRYRVLGSDGRLGEARPLGLSPGSALASPRAIARNDLGDWLIAAGAELTWLRAGQPTPLPTPREWLIWDVAFLDGAPVAAITSLARSSEERTIPFVVRWTGADWQPLAYERGIDLGLRGADAVMHRTRLTASVLLSSADGALWVGHVYRPRLLKLGSNGRVLLDLELGAHRGADGWTEPRPPNKLPPQHRRFLLGPAASNPQEHGVTDGRALLGLEMDAGPGATGWTQPRPPNKLPPQHRRAAGWTEPRPPNKLPPQHRRAAGRSTAGWTDPRPPNKLPPQHRRFHFRSPAADAQENGSVATVQRLAALAEAPDGSVYRLLAPLADDAASFVLERLDPSIGTLDGLALDLDELGHVQMAAGPAGLVFAPERQHFTLLLLSWNELAAANGSRISEHARSPSR